MSWPADPAVARAWRDQLVRGGHLNSEHEQALNQALERKRCSPGRWTKRPVTGHRPESTGRNPRRKRHRPQRPHPQPPPRPPRRTDRPGRATAITSKSKSLCREAAKQRRRTKAFLITYVSQLLRRPAATVVFTRKTVSYDMAKNTVQFQKGMSLPEFLKNYASEDACWEALFKLRWPEGFRCPECEHHSHCRLKSRKLIQCHRCHHQTSLTANTVFSHTKAAADDMVPGHFPVDPEQKRALRDGPVAPPWSLVQHRLAGQAQS